jgi:hypothetical protein
MDTAGAMAWRLVMPMASLLSSTSLRAALLAPRLR